ncbi:hypothetical protein Nepgr_007907 [Nepenthes gracilis]|uniref:Uncharacterized protein n=1 Tax=Nepenthes gracilis TaxID=150966 RepID=A0AAD3S7Q7_NEPGR|nr:hypothetical protein Nepgr_007907 [Nepenthes gracilis]
MQANHHLAYSSHRKSAYHHRQCCNCKQIKSLAPHHGVQDIRFEDTGGSGKCPQSLIQKLGSESMTSNNAGTTKTASMSNIHHLA